jgi:hypothetical protein
LACIENFIKRHYRVLLCFIVSQPAARAGFRPPATPVAAVCDRRLRAQAPVDCNTQFINFWIVCSDLNILGRPPCRATPSTILTQFSTKKYPQTSQCLTICLDFFAPFPQALPVPSAGSYLQLEIRPETLN